MERRGLRLLIVASLPFTSFMFFNYCLNYCQLAWQRDIFPGSACMAFDLHSLHMNEDMIDIRLQARATIETEGARGGF